MALPRVMMKKTETPEDFRTIKGFDLNLLTIFEAVYIHASVTKAAKALDLSPSSVSQYLHKLRTHFSDPLFVRKGKDISATTVATNIHQSIAKNYDDLLGKLQQLNDTTMHNRLVVHCSPYLSVKVLPLISLIAHQVAPDCKVVHTVNDPVENTAEEALIYRSADIVFDSNPHFGVATVSQRVFEEEIIFVCSSNHPRLKDSLSREQAENEVFAILDTDSDLIKEHQVNANNQFSGRKVVLQTGSLLSLISVVEGSDIIGSIPRWMYEKMASAFKIKHLTPNFPIKNVPIYMIYNKTSLKHKLFSDVMEQLNGQIKM